MKNKTILLILFISAILFVSFARCNDQTYPDSQPSDSSSRRMPDIVKAQKDTSKTIITH